MRPDRHGFTWAQGRRRPDPRQRDQQGADPQPHPRPGLSLQELELAADELLELGGPWIGEDLGRRPALPHLARCMNTTTSATRRAKPISWVTLIMVMP